MASLEFIDQRHTDRRWGFGDQLLRALRTNREPVTFTELTELVGDRRVLLSDVVAWTAKAQTTGVIELEQSGPYGPRRIRLTESGRQLAVGNRRRRDRRAA